MPVRVTPHSVTIMDFGPDDSIDPDGPVTPYKQLAGILAARIRGGEWAPGRRIASEKDLVQQYGLARSTVRRAIAVLVEDGVIYVVPQRGAFVADPPPPADTAGP